MQCPMTSFDCITCEGDCKLLVPRKMTQEEIDASLDLDEDCPMCGGSGVLDDECECMDDTCCCLVPTPPICPECGGG